MHRHRGTLAALTLAALLLAGCAPAAIDAGGAGGADPAAARPERNAEQRGLDERLRDAAWAGDAPEARRLIEAGADIDAKDDTEQSAYLIATSEGHLGLLRIALDSGASVDAKDRWNGTGLIRAAERGHGYVVGELLRAGIDRDHVNRIGYQAIHEAVVFGADTPEYRLTVRALIAGGAELDRPSGNEGETPLQMAEQGGLIGLGRALGRAAETEPVADADAALLAAAAAGDADAAAIALRAGADPDARTADARSTALMEAVVGDHVEVAQLLTAMGADPDALDAMRDTPWVMTGVTGSVTMLEALLPGRPDLAIRNSHGGTPVHPAAERGHVEYVKRAVQLDIDLDHVNTNGWTALLEAVVFGDGGDAHQEIVRTLLAAGADPGIRDANGATAIDHARSRGFTQIVDILG